MAPIDMDFSTKPSSYLLIYCLISLLFISTIKSDQTSGFTLDLIHRDSPLSPSYDPSLTRFERVRNSIRRSFSRHSSFRVRRAYLWPAASSPAPDSFDSSTISDDGAYLMTIHLGSPQRKEITAYADTGSDLTWTQCSPCLCYNQTAPFFEPENSASYKVAYCTSPQCAAVGNNACGKNFECKYFVTYGDGSRSFGDLAADTLTFVSISGETTSFERFYFGCGRINRGNFSPHDSGIIGLGGGGISLVRQLESSVGGRFSYCLTQMESHVPSRISFGTNAVVTGTNVVSTPLVKKDPDTFYYLTLDGFSVGSTRLDYYSEPESPATTKGNMVIDSGTTLTLISNDAYERLESALVKAIRGKRTSDPGNVLKLCYELQSNNGGKFSSPPITAHFTGADLLLPDTSTFLRVGDNVTCLTFMPADDVAIFGNLHQMNFHVGYDLEKGVVNFQPMDCAEYN